MLLPAPLPTTTHHYPPLPTTTYHYPPLPTTTHHYPPLPTTTHHYPPLPTTTHHYPPLPTTTHHYPPLPTTTHHYPPLPTTTHHYPPLPTTTHHYPPLHTTTHHYPPLPVPLPTSESVLLVNFTTSDFRWRHKSDVSQLISVYQTECQPFIIRHCSRAFWRDLLVTWSDVTWSWCHRLVYGGGWVRRTVLVAQSLAYEEWGRCRTATDSYVRSGPEQCWWQNSAGGTA